jgi:hypothetical protein
MLAGLLPVLLGGWLLGAAPSSQSLADIDGRPRTPLAPAPGDTHVVVFVSSDCPISNRYAPELARLTRDYAARRVKLLLVYEDASLSGDQARAHRAEYYPALEVTSILDPSHVLAKTASATVTPTAAIFTAEGRRYTGRIDNLYVAVGRARRVATEPTLRLALDAVLAGRAVLAAETQAIGCHIGGIE